MALAPIIADFKSYTGPGASMVREMLAGAQGKGKNYRSLVYRSPKEIMGLINSSLSKIVTDSTNLLKLPEATQALVGNKVIKNFTNWQNASTKISGQADYNTFALQMSSAGLNGLNSGNYNRRMGMNSAIIAKLNGLAESDLIRSRNKGLGNNVDTLYRNAAQKAAQEALAFQALSNEMTNKMNGQKLDKNSINDLATEITSQQRALYKSIGLDAHSFGTAFATALRSNAGTLAALINTANSRVNGTGGKGPHH